MSLEPVDPAAREAEAASVTIARWKKQRQVDFDIEFFDRILQASPALVDVLRIQGQLLTQRGHHLRALEVDRRLAQLRPQDAVVRYNLACSLTLLGQHREAIEALRDALECGYCDFDYMHEDPDLDAIRDLPDYEELLDEFDIQ